MNEKEVKFKNCEVSLETKESKKTGNEYQVLVIKFVNGYKKQVFLEEAEMFAIKDAVSKECQKN